MVIRYFPVLRRLGGAFFGRVFPGNVGGSFDFRFSFGPNATCAFREGVGPRAVGFSFGRMIDGFSLETGRRTRSALFRRARLAETGG
jgi:hypothetical protein